MRQHASFAVFALTCALGAQGSSKAAIPVAVDPRVELLSVVFRLAGNPEYSRGMLPGYCEAVDTHFAPVKDHAVVRRAQALRRKSGVSYDAVASFAVHLEGIDPPRFAGGKHPERLDKRWSKDDAKAFLKDLGDFAAEGKFAAFFAGQKKLYALAEGQMQKIADEQVRMAWFDEFFGERPEARFHVVLGLLNGPGNYGPSALGKDGSEDLYAILGCWDKDAAGMPRYDATIVPTLVHEYCHSYCNPLVEAHAKLLAKSGDALFQRTAQAMKAQAYGGGHTLLCESMVRASVIRYRATVEGDKAAAEEVKEQERCSFWWAGDIAAAMADEYEKDRKRYPTLHAFAPRLAELFAAAGPKLDARFAKFPKVVAMTPANGADDVDPATTTLTVTFDRAMQDGMWSVVGGGEHFPKIAGKPHYDAARKVFTVAIELKPDWDYELWLNRGKYDSFRGEDGTPLAPVQVRFHTRAK